MPWRAIEFLITDREPIEMTGTAEIHHNQAVLIMPLATLALMSMPCLLMVLTIVASRRLEAFPGKDDLWDLPRPSSLH